MAFYAWRFKNVYLNPVTCFLKAEVLRKSAILIAAIAASVPLFP
jgi:hypothetical protein